MLEQAQLVWSPKMDLASYLFYIGEPIANLSRRSGSVLARFPKLQEAVDKKIAEIHEQNPALKSKVKVGRSR